MAEILFYEKGQFEETKIKQHLIETDSYFLPNTSKRVNIDKWSKKLAANASLFVVIDKNKVVGLAAFYFNEAPDDTYGTHVCVLKEYQDEMYGVELILRMIEYAKTNGSKGFRCEIRKSNTPLVKFYKKLGFSVEKEIILDGTEETNLIIYKQF